MTGRAYSLCLLAAVLIGLVLTVTLVRVQAQRDRAWATQTRSATEMRLLGELAQAQERIQALEIEIADLETGIAVARATGVATPHERRWLEAFARRINCNEAQTVRD